MPGNPNEGGRRSHGDGSDLAPAGGGGLGRSHVRRQVIRFALGVAVLGLASIAVLTARGSERPPVTATAATSADSLADEARIRDLDIALYERRTLEDTRSAADRSRLAALYLQRSRETGSFSDVQRAESVAVSSLRLREAHNDETYSVLASARLAMHDFTGALEAAEQLVRRDPYESRHRALLGEVLLELGRYDDAATVFRALEGETSRLSVAPRLARWYELTGRLGQARNVMRYALRLARDDGSLTREQDAWFHLRLGELELKSGAVERAESLFVAGLRRAPEDYRLLGALARAAAMRRDWTAAIDAGERAIAANLDPATLGVLSDAWAALGDWGQSASYAGAMRLSALTQPGPIHRAWGLFLLDHGEQATEVLSRARRELATRRDVYGYDLVAWSLHTLGRDREAWPLMQRALAQGTEDAMLWYHASRVAEATGDAGAARALAQRAAAVNPRFHPTGAIAEGSPESTVHAPEGRGR